MTFITKNNRIYQADKQGPDDEIANFSFEIISDTTFYNDDGSFFHVYKIQAINEHGEVLPIIDVPSSEFESGSWTSKLGSKGTVLSPNVFRQALRETLRLPTTYTELID